MQPFFVLSTGRAGSTFLARTLEHYFQEDLNLHQAAHSRRKSIQANIELALNITPPLKKQLRSTVDPQQSIYLYNRLLSEPQQEVRIVVLIRDPRDFVSSMMNWKNRRMQSRISHHLIPFWSPVPLFHGIDFKDYLAMTKFEQFAWTWNFKNALFLSLHDCGYSVKVVKTEDIVNNSDTLQELLAFLDIDQPDLEKHEVSKNASTDLGFPHWKQWTPSQKRILNDHCQPLMEQFGYGLEVEWKSQ